MGDIKGKGTGLHTGGERDGGRDFATVYTEYRTALIRTSMRYVEDRSVAEDIVQDALAELWEKPERLEGVTNAEAYLHRWVTNRALNYLRDHGRRSVPLGGEDESESISSESILFSQNEEETAEMREIYELLFRAIDCLPERTREVVLLKLDGLTVPQIADRLGLSSETVKTHVKRAYSLLRSSLKLKSGSSSVFLMLLLLP